MPEHEPMWPLTNLHLGDTTLDHLVKLREELLEDVRLVGTALAAFEDNVLDAKEAHLFLMANGNLLWDNKDQHVIPSESEGRRGTWCSSPRFVNVGLPTGMCKNCGEEIPTVPQEYHDRGHIQI